MKTAYYAVNLALAGALAVAVSGCATSTPPAAAPAPAAAAPKKCDFSYVLRGDEAFEAASPTLSSAGKAKLDSELAGKLAACGSIKVVNITGHTDRATNDQKRSEAWAEAVRAHLLSKGVSNDVIETFGAGTTQPTPGVKCDDSLPREKLLACLAPNRRVVVDVVGMAK